MFRLDFIKLYCALLLCLVVIPLSQSQEQITNMGLTRYEEGSTPTYFVKFDDKMFFLANSNEYGIEIWAKSNIGDSARLLKDINPGKEHGVLGRFNRSSAVLNGTLYFFAIDGTSKGELWKTDGTTDGTEKVTNCINNRIEYITAIENKLYFLTVERSIDSIYL